MKTALWNPANGAASLANIAQLGAAGTSQVWIPAQPGAAQNAVFSALFGAESLLLATGAKPLPSTGSLAAMLAPLLPQGLALPQQPADVVPTLGDGEGFLNGADTSWNVDPNSRTPRQRAAIYVYAMNRAARNVVRGSRPFDGAPLMRDDASDPINPVFPSNENSLGAVPVGLLVLVGVLGVAAIAAAAYAVTKSTSEIAQPVTAMKVDQAAIMAQLAFDTQIALAQIKAGQPVTVSKIAETYANREKAEGTWLPIGLGSLLGAGAAYGISRLVSR